MRHPTTPPSPITAAVPAPTDVEHAVGCRRKAHPEAWGGNAAGGEGAGRLEGEEQEQQEEGGRPAEIYNIFRG